MFRRAINSKSFFYLLVFLLPISTAKVFFSDQSFFYAYHIFYHSFWLYLTDLVFGGLMLVWYKESIQYSPLPTRDRVRSYSGGVRALLYRISTTIKQDFLYQSVLAFWLILAISVLISHETLISAYGFLRFTEYLLIFVYVRENIHISREINAFFWLILAISVLETGFGIGQYLGQSSLGLKYLGESYLAPGMNGIAEFVSQGIGSWQDISGEMLVMRAYGTLPHPNVLAVLLFAGFFANLWLIYGVFQETPPPLSSPLKPTPKVSTLFGGPGKGEEFPSLEGRGWGRVKTASYETFLSLALILLSTGLVLTFSRTVWFVVLLALVALFVIFRAVKNRLFEKMQSGQRITGEANYYPKRVAIILLTLIVSLALNWLLFGQQIKDRLQGRGAAIFAEQESIVDRQHFVSVSREMIKTHPILGVGLRNFVVRMDEYNRPARLASDSAADGGDRLLPHQHQPVHNIYLLIAAETGLVGLAAFLLLVINIAKSAVASAKADANRGQRLILLVIFSGFLFLGLFDHYFISIHQSALLFWIVGGLAAAKISIL